MSPSSPKQRGSSGQMYGSQEQNVGCGDSQRYYQCTFVDRAYPDNNKMFGENANLPEFTHGCIDEQGGLVFLDIEVRRCVDNCDSFKSFDGYLFVHCRGFRLHDTVPIMFHCSLSSPRDLMKYARERLTYDL
eukprot:scaffold287871_cov57-Attheya_sp.AAC.2